MVEKIPAKAPRSCEGDGSPIVRPRGEDSGAARQSRPPPGGRAARLRRLRDPGRVRRLRPRLRRALPQSALYRRRPLPRPPRLTHTAAAKRRRSIAGGEARRVSAERRPRKRGPARPAAYAAEPARPRARPVAFGHATGGNAWLATLAALAPGYPPSPLRGAPGYHPFPRD